MFSRGFLKLSLERMLSQLLRSLEQSYLEAVIQKDSYQLMLEHPMIIGIRNPWHI